MSETSTLRSGPSRVQVLVTFISRTKRGRVALWWINFKGQPVKYHELVYCKPISIQTFENHPWMFTDANTGEKLSTSNGDFVYWPKQRNDRERECVIIDIPVYSLRDRTMQVVRQYFSTDDIQSADIPQTLKDDLLNTSRPL